MAAAPKELAAYAAITRKCSVRKLRRAAEGKRKTLFAINSRIVGKPSVIGKVRFARHPTGVSGQTQMWWAVDDSIQALEQRVSSNDAARHQLIFSVHL